MTCPACKTKRFMEFECAACCVRWLKQMTQEEMKYNAPMIERVAGVEQMEKAREAWKVCSAT